MTVRGGKGLERGDVRHRRLLECLVERRGDRMLVGLPWGMCLCMEAGTSWRVLLRRGVWIGLVSV